MLINFIEGEEEMLQLLVYKVICHFIGMELKDAHKAIERMYDLVQGCATFFTGGPLSKILTTSRASHRQICIKLYNAKHNPCIML